MKTTTPSKHLWLELRPDYIDANFQQVYEYLQSYRSPDARKDDSFYVTTIDLLRQRAHELVVEESDRPVCAEENPNRERGVFCLKLLCLYLLNESDTENPTFKEAFFTLLFHLSRCAKDSASAEQLIRVSLEVLSCEKIKATGVTWEVFNLFSPDILSHIILNGYSLVDDPERYVYLEKKGLLRANLGKVLLAPVNRDSLKVSMPNMIPALSFFQDSLQVLDSKSNRIKQGESEDIDKIEAFTDDFVKRQSTVSPVIRKLKQYAPGDGMDVELVSKGETLRVRTVDPEYEVIEGDFLISNPDKLLYYTIDDFRLYLNVGDQFPVKMQSFSNKGNTKFSVDDEFKDYVIDVLYKDEHQYKVVLAKLLDVLTNRNGKKQMLWWTEFGFPAYTDYEEGIENGQFCKIELSDTGAGAYKHFVNAFFDSAALPGEIFDPDLSKKVTISRFTYDDVLPGQTADNDVELSANLARQLCRMLFFYQRTLRSAVTRYRLLCTCRMIARLVEDETAVKYIEFVASYLENVVAFADDAYDEIKPLVYDSEEAEEDSVRMRKDIIGILMEYGKNEDSDVLDSFIDEDCDPMLVKLSKLVQSANRIQGVVSDNLLVHIKKEIISNLSIDSEKKTDLEVKKGTYYGTEDATKEFKPSFFEAPDNSEHPQDWNIFKEVCAFLNSELGGTLYMGVADSGYSLGLDRDLWNLGRIGNRSYGDNIDGYKRYILDDAKKFFQNNAVLMNLTFTCIEEGRVLAIKVNPWEGGIVEMDGKSFIRMDSESIEMDSRMKDETVRKKLLSKKDESSNVRSLMEAIEGRKKVILHGYSSSRTTEDRLDMEPFAFDDDYQTVWCYDPSADKCKSYKVSRIGSTEVLDKSWTNGIKHKQGKTDIFRMTGENDLTVRLQLDQYAKILLCEEFPKAIDLLVPNAARNSWYLETKVRSLAGVGRFYIGLGKSHVSIIESPELEEYVKKYTAENLL